MPSYRDPRAYYGPKLKRMCARRGCPLAARPGHDRCALDDPRATAAEISAAELELDIYNGVPTWRRRPRAPG